MSFVYLFVSLFSIFKEFSSPLELSIVDPLVIEEANMPWASPLLLKEEEVSFIIGTRVGGLFGGVALDAPEGLSLID